MYNNGKVEIILGEEIKLSLRAIFALSENIYINYTMYTTGNFINYFEVRLSRNLIKCYLECYTE